MNASPKHAWWETRWFAIAMIALAAIPLLLPPIPPLTDLMGHMGRYRVQLDIGSSPWLGRYYRFDWGLIGNLGCDLLVELLGPLLGLELAVKLIVLAIPPLTVAGLLLLAREIHGRVPPTALFALPLAYGYPFQFGFLNFALAMALMLIAFAWWLRLARTGRLAARPWIFLVVAFLIWVAHSFAWGTLGLLCFIAEAVRGRRAGMAWLPALWKAGLAVLPLAPPALLLLPWRGGAAPRGTFDWFNWNFKWRWLYSVLRERVELWDRAGAALLYAVALSGLVAPRRRYDAVLGLAALLLAIVFVCLPRVLLSSAYADMRLVPYMLALAILALRPIARPRVALAVALVATGFFAARIAVSTAAFLRYERNYQAQLKALDHVPMGARVMVLATVPCRNVWYTTRMEHLSSMATVRRHSFVNDQWVAPGAQLLRIRYRAAGRYFSHDPSQLLRRPDCRARNEPVLELALAKFPRAAFDYLWMIDMPRDRWPRDPGLVPVWTGRRFGILYRITANQDGSAIASSETPKGSARRVTQ
ncbi:hypothetical protein [Sphingomonas morindae]|uniref:Glycosyltransferase RgtA/B/C/D-like domain-containing protein n=1 Tax=Sphingomonas morindae TaxID=1541170 RepID=A0ABY4XB60_9SPHN|nr:hypothetical protein [Sphingomonas morindae]USI74207.1 hypothetical protein LHA26_07075 [Sphingomonas morindae]